MLLTDSMDFASVFPFYCCFVLDYSREIIFPTSDDWSSASAWKYMGVTALGMSVWVFLERSYCGRKDIPCSWVLSRHGWNKEKMRKKSHTDVSIPLCSAAICFLGHWNVQRQPRQSTTTARIRSCPWAFCTMMDWTFKLWAKANPPLNHLNTSCHVLGQCFTLH